MADLTLDDLAKLPRWVTWRNEKRDGKTTKVPYDPRRTARRAKANDPDTWATRTEAEASASVVVKGQGGGIGIELGDLGNGRAIGGIDLDTCRRADGSFEPWALNIIQRFGSYAEISPSGSGAKLFFTYDQPSKPALQAAMRTEHGKQWKRITGQEHPPAIELHLSNRYFAVTGFHLPDTPRELRQMPLQLLIELIQQTGPNFAREQTAGGGGLDGSRSAIAFRKGKALSQGGANFEEMVGGLLADPETAAWAREKGQANNGRELQRIWGKAEPAKLPNNTVPPPNDGHTLSAEEVAGEIDRLTRLSHTEYAVARKRAAQVLLMGVTDLDKVLKVQRAKRRGEADAEHRKRPEPLPGETVWPLGFLPRDDGLYYDAGADEGPVWLSEPIEVLGQGRDADGESWGLWLRWRDPDGHIHTWPMQMGMTIAQPGELEAALIDRGLRINPHPAARQHLRNGLAGVQSGARVRFADAPGWCAPGQGPAAFTLIDGTVIGDSAEQIVLKTKPENAGTKMATTGTLEGWRETIAAKARGNPVAAFAICAAFAGPLLEPLGEASGGFHFHGRSKAGKTLAMRMGISVWGPPKKAGLLKDWRSTANALEGAAEECNDGFLTLDEIHQADAREVVGAVYQLANESGKQRLTREAVSKRRRTWRTVVMSTGEIDVATMSAKHSSSPLPAGAEVRLPSIPIDGRDMWPELHGDARPQALMAFLHQALLRNYGTPIRAFLRKLADVRGQDDGSLEAAFEEMRETFYAQLSGEADAQVKEVARRCALIGLAGEFATEWGILPWQKKDAIKAAETILQWWINRRGGIGSTEESQHVKAVRAYLSEYGSSRFVALDRECQGPAESWTERYPDRPIPSRSGWRRMAGEASGDEYLLDKDGWQKICAGYGANPVEVARTLRAANHLAPGDGKNLTKIVRIPNLGRVRCYIVRPTIFADAEDAKVEAA